jgi:serine protease inhibitor
VQQATSVRAYLIDSSYTKTFNIWRLNPQAPIDAALQSAHIRVDRRGISFSSTTVIHVLKSMQRRTPEITIDHPFFFAVTDDKSQNILVAGKVAQLEPRADACVSATELISRRGNGGTATGQR